MAHMESLSKLPSPWVARFLSGVAAGGTVLDVACGGGRNLRAALAAGYQVVGMDRVLTGVADLAGHPGVWLVASDLEDGSPFPLAGERYAGVIVTNYLWRPILPDIVAAVADDGLLIYETFAVGQEQLGRPQNPDFLLRPGELLGAVAARLTPVCYEHGRLGEPERLVQRIAAVGPAHPWRTDPPRLP